MQLLTNTHVFYMGNYSYFIFLLSIMYAWLSGGLQFLNLCKTSVSFGMYHLAAGPCGEENAEEKRTSERCCPWDIASSPKK